MEGKNGGEDKEQKREEETRKQSQSSVKTPAGYESPAADETPSSSDEQNTPDAATTMAKTLDTIGHLEQLQLDATALAEANGTDLGQQMDAVAAQSGLYGQGCTTARCTAASPAGTTNADLKESKNTDIDANGRHGVNMSTPTTSVAPVAAASSSTPPAPRGAIYDGQIGRIVDSVIAAMSEGGDLKKMRRIFRGALVKVLRIRGDTTVCLVNPDSSGILHGLFLVYTIKSGEGDQVELGDDVEMKKMYPDEISHAFIYFTDQDEFVILVRCFDIKDTSTMLGYGDLHVCGRLYTGSRPIGESDLASLPEQRRVSMLFGPLHLNEIIFEEYMSKVLPSLVMKKLVGEPIFRITTVDLEQASLLRFLFQGLSIAGIPSRLSDSPCH